jgi:DNA repair protein RadD
MLLDASKPGNSIISLPTGSGKSHIISAFADELNEDILILAPSKELVEQDIEKLKQAGVSPEEIGVYTASLNSKTIKKFTFGIVQSVFKHPELFTHFKFVLIDECHEVDPNNPKTMYRNLIRKMGSPKVIGLTATPWRNVVKQQWIPGRMTSVTSLEILCRAKSGFWDRIIYNKNNADLTPEYLCPIYYETGTLINPDRIPVKGTDYDISKYSMITSLNDYRTKIINAVYNARGRFNSILVFCPSIENANWLKGIIPGSEVVTGKTPKKERTRIINGFKDGSIKIVLNVEVLTTGFDHPALDCIILNRPTKSIGLYYQMLGRGVRQHPNKKECTVIDLSGTYQKLGGIADIAVEPNLGEWDLKTSNKYWNGVEIARFTKQR